MYPYNNDVDEENLLPISLAGPDTTNGSGGGRGITRDMVNGASSSQQRKSSLKKIEKRKWNYNMCFGGGGGRFSKKLYIMIVTLTAASLLFGMFLLILNLTILISFNSDISLK